MIVYRKGVEKKSHQRTSCFLGLCLLCSFTSLVVTIFQLPRLEFYQDQDWKFIKIRSRFLYEDVSKYLHFYLKCHSSTCVGQNVFHYSSANQLIPFPVSRMEIFNAYKSLLFSATLQNNFSVENWSVRVLFAATSFIDITLLMILISLFLLISKHVCTSILHILSVFHQCKIYPNRCDFW